MVKANLKKILAILLAVLFIFAVGCKQSGKGDTGDTASDIQTEEKSIKILAVGNSFSVDAMEHLWHMFKVGGYKEIVLGNLYIASCSLDMHWDNICKRADGYTYYKNTNGRWIDNKNFRLQDALEEEDWDIITLQQASGTSGMSYTYFNLKNIADYMIKYRPKETTEIMWHMTWAYQGDCTRASFADYNKDQLNMYGSIADAVNEKVLTNENIAKVIPSGTAIQNMRTSYYGDTITRDGFHLSKGVGRYTAALTWYCTITGNEPDSVDWVPPSFPEISKELDVIRESVANAVSSPYAVTQSSITSQPQ